MLKQNLLGRWTIKQWTQTYDDGRVTYPMGPSLRGLIQYDADRMFCFIERTDRPRFSSGGQWNANDSDKARAYDGFMSYSGTYEIHGDEVRHHVDISLYPDWEGGIQRRRASLRDGQLYLSARLEEGTEQARTADLIWERTP